MKSIERLNARSVLVFLALMLAGTSVHSAELLEKHVFTADPGTALPYRLARPAVMEVGVRFPLVIVLHGAGERGDDNEAQLRSIVPVFLNAENRVRHPCFLVAPQCPLDAKWTGVNWQQDPHAPQTTDPTRPAALVFALVGRLLAELPIDPARVYLTGSSMGGSGAWDFATRRPELFAAVVPVCGGADEATGHRLAAMPVWCFQGGQDDVVRPSISRNMIDAIRRAGGTPRYTEFPAAGHSIAAQVYSDPAVIEWLFAQRRAARP